MSVSKVDVRIIVNYSHHGETDSGALSSDYIVHVLSDGGASVAATTRRIRIKINGELTD